MIEINSPDKLLTLSSEDLKKYLTERLEGKADSPPLDWRIGERLEDVFIQALYTKESSTRQKEEYGDLLVEVVSLALKEELQTNWQKDAKKHALANQEDFLLPFERRHKSTLYMIQENNPESWKYVNQLIYLAQELGDEKPGMAIFETVSQYLFPPQTIAPLPIEIHFLRMITLVQKPAARQWWNMWIAEMELNRSKGDEISDMAKASRARLPMVIFGLITTCPSLAIDYVTRTLEYIRCDQVKTDPVFFMQDVIQGLIACYYKEGDMYYLHELANKAILSSDENFNVVKQALESITFRDNEVNKKIENIVNMMQENRCGRVKIDRVFLLQDVIKGLIARYYKEGDTYYLHELADKAILSSDENFNIAKKALESITSRDNEVNKKIENIVNMMQEGKDCFNLAVNVSVNTKSGIGAGTNYWESPTLAESQRSSRGQDHSVVQIQKEDSQGNRQKKVVSVQQYEIPCSDSEPAAVATRKHGATVNSRKEKKIKKVRLILSTQPT